MVLRREAYTRMPNRHQDYTKRNHSSFHRHIINLIVPYLAFKPAA